MEDEGFDREEARRELKGYLNEKMRVFISDGRVVEGTFQCTDKHRNLVLANCEEYLSVEELEASTARSPVDKWKKVPPRTLNLAIIPGDHILSIHLAMDASEPSSSRENSPPPVLSISGTCSSPTTTTMAAQDSSATDNCPASHNDCAIRTSTIDTPPCDSHVAPSNIIMSDTCTESSS